MTISSFAVNCNKLLHVIFFNESVVFRQVGLRNSELEKLSRESLGVVVVLWHSDNQVVARGDYLRYYIELSIRKWVKLNKFVILIDLELFVLHDKIEDQKEAAANFLDAFWLSARKNDQFVVNNEGTLHMEVLNFEVLRRVRQPLPLLCFVACASINTVYS